MERTHHRLKAWQQSIELVSLVYISTKSFPRHEVYALTAQMRRSAVSIASNIAEGAARTSVKEFLNYLSMARGSLSELETQIIISQRLGYLKSDRKLDEKVEVMFQLIGGLIQSIKSKGA